MRSRVPLSNIDNIPCVIDLKQSMKIPKLKKSSVSFKDEPALRKSISTPVRRRSPIDTGTARVDFPQKSREEIFELISQKCHGISSILEDHFQRLDPENTSKLSRELDSFLHSCGEALLSSNEKENSSHYDVSTELQIVGSEDTQWRFGIAEDDDFSNEAGVMHWDNVDDVISVKLSNKNGKDAQVMLTTPWDDDNIVDMNETVLNGTPTFPAMIDVNTPQTISKRSASKSKTKTAVNVDYGGEVLPPPPPKRRGRRASVGGKKLIKKVDRDSTGSEEQFIPNVLASASSPDMADIPLGSIEQRLFTELPEISTPIHLCPKKKVGTSECKAHEEDESAISQMIKDISMIDISDALRTCGHSVKANTNISSNSVCIMYMFIILQRLAPVDAIDSGGIIRDLLRWTGSITSDSETTGGARKRVGFVDVDGSSVPPPNDRRPQSWNSTFETLIRCDNFIESCEKIRRHDTLVQLCIEVTKQLRKDANLRHMKHSVSSIDISVSEMKAQLSMLHCELAYSRGDKTDLRTRMAWMASSVIRFHLRWLLDPPPADISVPGVASSSISYRSNFHQVSDILDKLPAIMSVIMVDISKDDFTVTGNTSGSPPELTVSYVFSSALEVWRQHTHSSTTFSNLTSSNSVDEAKVCLRFSL